MHTWWAETRAAEVRQITRSERAAHRRKESKCSCYKKSGRLAAWLTALIPKKWTLHSPTDIYIQYQPPASISRKKTPPSLALVTGTPNLTFNCGAKLHLHHCPSQNASAFQARSRRANKWLMFPTATFRAGLPMILIGLPRPQRGRKLHLSAVSIFKASLWGRELVEWEKYKRVSTLSKQRETSWNGQHACKFISLCFNWSTRREFLHFSGRVFWCSHPGPLFQPAAKFFINLDTRVGGGTWERREGGDSHTQRYLLWTGKGHDPSICMALHDGKHGGHAWFIITVCEVLTSWRKIPI